MASDIATYVIKFRTSSQFLSWKSYIDVRPWFGLEAAKQADLCELIWTDSLPGSLWGTRMFQYDKQLPF